MLHITIIALGKIKESYWNEAIKEYLKRLQGFAKIEIKELKEESFSEKDKAESIKQKEAEYIIKALPKDSFVIALDETGKELSSTQLAAGLERIQLMNSSITVIIGGPLGLDQSIRDKANLTLSLSQLTFTHQMARVFVLEQLYRAFMINNNRKYHY